MLTPVKIYSKFGNLNYQNGGLFRINIAYEKN